MNYAYINRKILEVYKNGNIISFPFNCEQILKELGYNLYKYSELSESKRNHCLLVSDEALKLFDNIYYNDNMPKTRVRFSLAHELGHIVLEHGDYLVPENEAEANYFASYLLAPRIAIHYARCENEKEVSRIFNMSNEAARYAFNDYLRWHRKIAIYKMSSLDKSLYEHFYDVDYKGFVYNKKRCGYCEEPIYNSSEIICQKCNALSKPYLNYRQPDEDLLIVESQWLYARL